MRFNKSLKKYTLRTYNVGFVFNDSWMLRMAKITLSSLLVLLLSGCCCW